MSNSVFGAALAVAISLFVWPHWERHRIAHVVASAIEASALRVAATGADAGVLLAELRRKACVATDRAEASMERMRVEPNAGARWKMDDKTVIAALRRTIGAATLIELSVAASGLPSTAERIGAFAGWVDDEMARSAALLRENTSLTDRLGNRTPQRFDGSITISMQNTLKRISCGVHTVCDIARGNSVLKNEGKAVLRKGGSAPGS